MNHPGVRRIDSSTAAQPSFEVIETALRRVAASGTLPDGSRASPETAGWLDWVIDQLHHIQLAASPAGAHGFTGPDLVDAYRAGFISACRWPEPVTQDADSPAVRAEAEAFVARLRATLSNQHDERADSTAVQGTHMRNGS